MSSLEELVQRFKQHGYKMTPQRWAILEVLTGNTHHPTAEQIHGLVKERMPDISLATVYNTLHELTDLEELCELDVGHGVRRYQISWGDHAHRVCLGCGRIEDAPGDCEKLKLLFQCGEGFCPVRYAVTIYGYCADCTSSLGKSAIARGGIMNTGTNATLTALNQAIELEIEGQRFYLKAAECTTNPTGREMFRSLADDEVIHERILRRQLDALTQGEGWVLPEGVAEVTANLAALIFPQSEKVCGDALRPDESDLDALLFALQIENESFELYREMAEKTEDPNGQRMYEYLANAERGHFEQLMLNYEHLSTVGSWASL